MQHTVNLSSRFLLWTHLLSFALPLACRTGDLRANLPRDRRPQAEGALGTRLVDSIIIRENDSLYIGSPAATFRVASNGEFFIPDESTDRIIRFGADGRLLGTYGHSGDGPGEFRSMGSFGLVTDSLVLWDSPRHRRVNIFGRNSYRYLGQFKYEGYLSWISEGRGGIVIGLSDIVRGLAVARFSWERFFATINDSSEVVTAAFASSPQEYGQYPLLSAWNDVKAVDAGSNVLIAFGGTDRIERYSAEGRRLPAVFLPVVMRRGVPREALARFFIQRPTSAKEARRSHDETSRAISALLGLWGLPDTTVLIWYQDPYFEENGRVLKGTAYLSLVSKDMRSVCVDAKLEAPGSGRPRLALDGDKIALLDQVVPPSPSSRVITVIRRYALDTDSCTWLPTGIN